jgi:hypothetical protein
VGPDLSSEETKIPDQSFTRETSDQRLMLAQLNLALGTDRLRPRNEWYRENVSAVFATATEEVSTSVSTTQRREEVMIAIRL